MAYKFSRWEAVLVNFIGRKIKIYRADSDWSSVSDS